MEISSEVFTWRKAKDSAAMHVLMYLIVSAEDYFITTSVAKISNATGVSDKKVRLTLSELENDGIITKQSTKASTNIQLWRYVIKSKKKKKSAVVTTELDLTSFVAPQHLDAWKEWLEYKKEIRKLYATSIGAKKEYNHLLKISSITHRDASGTEVTVVDDNWLIANIDFSISKNWQGLFQDKSYGNNNYNNSNPGRTTQADAERIAAQHAAQAAQSSISAEEHAARIEAELALLEAAQQYK